MDLPDDFPRRPEAAAVDPLFVTRWSTRAFSDEPVPDDLLMSLFEAARWTPSSFNGQPWRFLFARTEDDLAVFRPLINDHNRVWADRAPVLAFVLAARHRADGRPNRHAEFDAGAAWMSLALQAHTVGLWTHAMAGFHRDLAYDALRVPRERYVILCGIAIGYRGDPDRLPEAKRKGEVPKGREPLSAIIHEGALTTP